MKYSFYHFCWGASESPLRSCGPNLQHSIPPFHRRLRRSSLPLSSDSPFFTFKAPLIPNDSAEWYHGTPASLIWYTLSWSEILDLFFPSFVLSTSGSSPCSRYHMFQTVFFFLYVYPSYPPSESRQFYSFRVILHIVQAAVPPCQ